MTVFILGIVALAAIPSFTSGNPARLDLAAEEVASALRFARSEAVRTGKPHGVIGSTAAQSLRVYWLDESGAFPTPTYTVRHPLDKKLYDLQFASDPLLAGVTLSAVTFTFEGMFGTSNYVGFNPTGLPKYNDSGIPRMLASGEIRVSCAGDERVVRVQPETGRVSIDG